MSSEFVRGKPFLVEIDRPLLKAAKAEAARRGWTYRRFFEEALRRELGPEMLTELEKQLQAAESPEKSSRLRRAG